MSSFDPEGVLPFKWAGKTYKLFFGMRARKAIEAHYDLPFFRGLEKALPSLTATDAKNDEERARELGMNVSLTDLSKVFECVLLKYHPDIKEEEVDDLIDEIGLERATGLIADALQASFGEEAGEPTANPPPRASQKKKTGSPALQNG